MIRRRRNRRTREQADPDVEMKAPRVEASPPEEDDQPVRVIRGIVWSEEKPPKTPPAKPPAGGKDRQPGTEKIDWGMSDAGGQPDLKGLIGVEDAFDHTPLQAGEKIAFCTLDKVAYHLQTWDFLRAQNHGRCCICGQSSGIRIYTLPGTYAGRALTFSVAQPSIQVYPGEKIISLDEVRDHLNRAVIVEDLVHKVHRSQKGTYFIRFETLKRGDPVYSGFKAVIFEGYTSRWEEAGIPITSYQNKLIRVRGVVQEHEIWGIEILVNSPQLIEIVQSAKI